MNVPPFPLRDYACPSSLLDVPGPLGSLSTSAVCSPRRGGASLGTVHWSSIRIVRARSEHNPAGLNPHGEQQATQHALSIGNNPSTLLTPAGTAPPRNLQPGLCAAGCRIPGYALRSGPRLSLRAASFAKFMPRAPYSGSPTACQIDPDRFDPSPMLIKSIRSFAMVGYIALRCRSPPPPVAALGTSPRGPG